MSETGKVAVIGAGTMGHGIAYASALAGFDTVLSDASEAALATAAGRVAAAFDAAVERGKLDAGQQASAMARLGYEGNLESAVESSFLVVEAIPENMEWKRDLFERIERIASDSTILASNTSSLSITSIAGKLRRPERFIGLHFFNPVPVMKLLEIVRGERTSGPTVEAAKEFAATLGKTAIVVRDTPGFATSRLGVVIGLEAMRMLEQGVASAEDIDRAMELGYNHPMGPLRLTDLVGLDVRLAIAENLHATFGDDTYRPPQILRDLVASGNLGKKSGRGFYEWTKESRSPSH